MENRHFEEGGADYANHRPTYPAELAKALADLCPAKKCAVDVGCGTGQLSVLLGGHFDNVIASDVSAGQIDNATHHPNVTYKIGPAERLKADDASADLIVAAQAAHWFDLPAFYEEVKRVAKPNALLALVTYGVFEVSGPARDLVHDFYWGNLHTYWPKGREAVENGYRDLDFPFEQLALPSLAIKRNWLASNLINYINTWSATKQARQAGTENLLDQFEKDLRAIVAEEHFSVTWPISVRAGRVA